MAKKLVSDIEHPLALFSSFVSPSFGIRHLNHKRYGTHFHIGERTEPNYLDPVQNNTRQTQPKVPKFAIFVLSSHEHLGLRITIINMDPRYTGEILKHLEKQNELLTEAKISMSEELHQLKVEEEMLMRKFYEIMSAHGKVKKNHGCGKVSDDGEIGSSAALASTTNDDEC